MAIRAKRGGTKTQGVCLLLVCAAMTATSAWADSVASKNREGNRLFESGKFQEAEKTYLDAQAQSPGRPEILYNLGNSLIKQKKYDQALQSLRQATSKAGKPLEANTWYNIGDALFEMSDFKDAAQAYVQALKIDPADQDAKHNLELALRNLKQQQEKEQSSQDSKSNDQKSNENKESAEKKQKEGQDRQQQRAQQKQDHQQNPNVQSVQNEGQDEELSKERALQILDALRNEELADRRKLQEHGARSKAIGKDW